MVSRLAALAFRSPQTRLVCVGVLALLAIVGAIYLWRNDPTSSAAIFAPCWFHRFTGFFCPGCGATRSGHALLNGRVILAADYNLFFVLVAIIIPIPLAMKVREWVMGQSPKLASTRVRRWIFWIPWLVIAFTLMRNLPWEPFTWLAP